MIGCFESHDKILIETDVFIRGICSEYYKKSHRKDLRGNDQLR